MKTCRSCNTSKSTAEFNKLSSSKDGLKDVCRLCQKSYNNKYLLSGKKRNSELKAKYGVPREVLDKMYVVQEGKCAICGEFKTEYNKRGGLYIDHCHQTNIVRGLLCNSCNVVIGMAKEDTSILLKAIEYLVKRKVSLLS